MRASTSTCRRAGQLVGQGTERMPHRERLRQQGEDVQDHVDDLLRIQRDLALALSHTRDLDDAAYRCLETALEITGVDCGGVYTTEPPDGDLLLRAHAGFRTAFAERTARWPRDSKRGRVVHAGQPIYTRYHELMPDRQDAEDFEGLRALAVIPILHGDEVVACLNVASHTEQEIPPTGRRSLEATAVQIGGAITRLRAESALRASEQRYRLLAENTSDVIFLADPRLRITYVSPSVEALRHCSVEETLQQRADEILTPTSLETVQGRIAEVLAQHLTPSAAPAPLPPIEIEIYRGDGTTVWVEVTVVLIDDTGSGEPSFLCVARDMTARHQVEQERQLHLAEVRQAAAEMRRIMDAVGLPIVVLDTEARLVMRNRATEALPGAERLTANGATLRAVAEIEPWAVIHKLVADLSRDVRHRSGQARDRDSKRTWEITATLSPGEAGDDRFIVVVRDTTQYLALQERLRRGATMSAMGALVGAVAHEVRNPLFGITATLDAFAARYGDREEFESYLQVLRGETERMARLMKDLLDYGRSAVLEPAPVQIVDVVTGAIAACQAVAQERSVEIVAHSVEECPTCSGDEERLVQAFRNVIENAIQHSPDRGRVAVEGRCGQEGDTRWFKCTVRDRGPGFRPDEIDRVLEPFFTRRRRGIGLGLSIVQKIVDEHGGRISLGNAAGGGAWVTVTLPCRATPDRREDAGS